jgi:hypothetical protein
MPRVPDELLRSVVYLFQDEEHAREGRGAGGTGFLVDYLDDQIGSRHCYVVSNVHVVMNGCTTLRVNKNNGLVATFAIPETAWVTHPDGDDVVVAPIDFEIPPGWDVGALQWENFYPTAERIEELNVGIGDDVVMLGRFVGHTGRQQNQPLARFGSIAMMLGERVKDGRGLLVDAYLVEMRSLPGFSGSPVFIYIGPGSYRGNDTMMPFYSETIGLLGIDTGHKPLTNPVIDQASGKPVEPAQVVQQNSGVAIVAPFSKIQELLDEELEKQRRTAAKE